jgi:hypothetical protein
MIKLRKRIVFGVGLHVSTKNVNNNLNIPKSLKVLLTTTTGQYFVFIFY